MFASFCLHYAGVPESEFPEDAGVYAWMTDLKKLSRYADAADYTPVPGDIIFFDNDGDKEADHVGIVEEVNSKGDKIKTIEGNSSNKVKENSYSASDKAIVGYGILPEQGESKEVSDPEVPYDTPSLTEQTVKAQILSDESAVQTMSASAPESVILSGLLPENATATAVPVDVQIGDMTILAAYDITIYDENGYEFEPEDGQIHVTICNSAIRNAMDQGAEPVVYHINDETSVLENVDVTAADDGAVEFDAESFSIYIVGENDEYINTETGDHVTVYTVEFYQYEFDAESETAKGPTKVSTQYVAQGEEDYLNEPAVPEYEHHLFDGWFTEMQISRENEPGNKYDFSLTLDENLVAWGDSYQLIGHTIKLYTDYDPVYYVYFMTEEDPKLDPDDENYEPYVFHTNVYHDNNSALDTSDVGILYWQQYLQVELDQSDLTTYAVVNWYYYEDGAEHTEGNRKYISAEDLTDDDGVFHIVDDIYLYPLVDGAIWIYFDMNADSDYDEIYIEPSPAYVLASATYVGDVLTEPERSGYTFAGWFTEDGNEVTSETTFDQLKNYRSSDGTVTLYAKWDSDYVSYTINIWRQKATDGATGINQKEIVTGETFDDYIGYYDYAESIHVSESESQLKTGDTPTTDTVNGWSTYTKYGNITDNTSAYYGFEYDAGSGNDNTGRTTSATRTLNELATVEMAPDGSTIINIYYNRVTVTWTFGTNSSRTLIGLYGTNCAQGSDNAGYYSDWPEAGNNQIWRIGSNGSSVTFETTFVILNSSASVTFQTTSGGSNNYYYYYLEITNENQLNTEKQAEAENYGVDYIRQVEGTWYRYERRAEGSASSFTITDKYTGYEVVGYNKMTHNSKDSSNTYEETKEGETIDVRSGIISYTYYDLYIFNNARKYTITLESNEKNIGFDDVTGEQKVGGNEATYTFKYGQDLTSTDFPVELDPELFGPAYYYQFTGTWWEDPTFTAVFQKPDSMPANNLVAYADWELKDITVTFVSSVDSNLSELLRGAYGEYDEVNNPGGVIDDGDGSYSIIIKASESVDDRLAELIAVYEEGSEDEGRYIFVSWMNGTSIFNITGHLYDDTTLVASWNDTDKKHYTLIYDINLSEYTGDQKWSDGVGHYVDAQAGVELGEVEEIFNKTNTDAILSEEQIEKFICWNTEPDGSGTDYYPGYEFSFAGATDNITLYAKWAIELESTLHIHYNYPEGYDETREDEYPDVDITVENLGTVDLSQSEEGDENGYYVALQDGAEITIAGVTYRFVGWSTDPDATSAEIPAGATVAVDGSDTTDEDGNVTRINELYAVWLAETQFTIEKTNANYEELEGAVFTLTYTVTEGEGDKTTTTTYYYSYDTATGNGSWSTTYNTITLGTISFHDSISDFDGSETFILTEISAPDGYQKIESPITFTFNANNATISIVSGAYSENNALQAEASGTKLTVIDPSDSFDVYILKYTGDYESTPPGSDLDADDDDNSPSYIALSGAEFILSKTVEIGGTAVTQYAKFDFEAQSGDNVYTLTEWVEDLSEANTLTSDGNGSIGLQGLQVGTYTLTETKAPDGYMLLSEGIEFTVNADGSVTVDEKYADEYNESLIVIGNEAGTELPNTGGPGTWMYILTGIVMMSGAGFLFYRKKRSEVRA